MGIADTTDYSVLDRPEVLQVLFHPRPEPPSAAASTSGLDLQIAVEAAVHVGARFYKAGTDAANLLFFHGNGEIVADYEEIGTLYQRLGINFLPVDYRGYGRSSGTPTVEAMMHDSHAVCRFVVKWLPNRGCRGPMLVMGRSLGSACALELAAACPHVFKGLIVESGFAYAAPLLRLLGVDPQAVGFAEKHGFGNIDKICRCKQPTLIIHAEGDAIIPFSDARALYNACGAADKTLLPIANADHNDLLARGLSAYLTAIATLALKLR
jgi:fermentation-respiration switch protein FrsA (DUF1100 family)